jgi:hypothetical protein
MPQERYLTANPDIVCRAEGDEALLYDPVTDDVRVLNATGLSLWTLCDGRHTREDLIAHLAAEFPGVGYHTLGADVDAFVAELADKNLLATA